MSQTFPVRQVETMVAGTAMDLPSRAILVERADETYATVVVRMQDQTADVTLTLLTGVLHPFAITRYTASGTNADAIKAAR